MAKMQQMDDHADEQAMNDPTVYGAVKPQPEFIVHQEVHPGLSILQEIKLKLDSLTNTAGSWKFCNQIQKIIEVREAGLKDEAFLDYVVEYDENNNSQLATLVCNLLGVIFVDDVEEEVIHMLDRDLQALREYLYTNWLIKFGDGAD
jgi:hypothetical protein